MIRVNTLTLQFILNKISFMNLPSNILFFSCATAHKKKTPLVGAGDL